MAALNERDERWIVQERADGANCNNWHWTFKDVTARTKAALDERLKAVEFPPGLEGCRITSCTATGECSFSNRKGRLFLTYELDVTLGLTVEPSGGGGDATEASLRFPDVSATEIDDLQCVLSVKNSRALVVDEEDSELESRGSPTAIPAAVRAQAVPFLTQRLRQEVLALQEELRAEHAEHAPPTVRRSRLQPFPGLAPFRAWRLGVCVWLPALTTLSPLCAQAGPAPLHAPVPQPIPQPLKMDHAQADAAAAAASAVSAYAVKGAAARGRGAVAARAAAAAVAHGAGGQGGAEVDPEAEGGDGEEGEEGEEDSLPPPLCAALAQLQRVAQQVGEPPRVLRLSNCGLRDVHLLPLIDALQVRGVAC